MGGVVIVSQLVSKKGISEYYFTNLTVIPILLVSVFTSYSYLNSRKNIILLILGGFLLTNTYFLIKMPDFEDSYLEKREWWNISKTIWPKIITLVLESII